MADRLIPIGHDENSINVHDALSELIAKIAGAGNKMDVFCGPAAINLMASFDRYFNEEISCDELIYRINSTLLPT